MSIWLFHGVGMVAVACTAIGRSERVAIKALVGLALASLLLGIGPGGHGHGVFRFLAMWDVLLFIYLPILALLGGYRWRKLGGLPLVLVGAWAHFIEPEWLEVSHEKVAVEGLDEPLRIVVLADLQTDGMGTREVAALTAIAGAKPDLVLMTGDYLQIEGDADFHRVATDFVEAWTAAGIAPPMGTWAVPGDIDRLGLDPVLSGLPVHRIPDTTRLDLGPLELVGLDLRDSVQGISLSPAEKPRIVFGHRPDFALRMQADLMVAGHTHGGQVQIPGFGPLITLSNVPRDWAHGRTNLPDGSTLVVSRGVGMERGDAPRIRFFCRPEVVVVDLVPDDRLVASRAGE